MIITNLLVMQFGTNKCIQRPSLGKSVKWPKWAKEQHKFHFKQALQAQNGTMCTTVDGTMSQLHLLNQVLDQN